MNKLLLACDLHNTLVYAQEAWSEAFSECTKIERDKIDEYLRSKISRKILAKQLGCSYDSVYEIYRKRIKPIDSVIEFVKIFESYGIPIIIISAASKERVYNDLEVIKEYFEICEIYCKENFKKNSYKDWEALINKYGCQRILYLGNDKSEDIISHEKVISIIINDSGRVHGETFELFTR